MSCLQLHQLQQLKQCNKNINKVNIKKGDLQHIVHKVLAKLYTT